jgi:hypothetical protein
VREGGSCAASVGRVENRFRIDDDDLGIDLRASSVSLGSDGVVDATVVAARLPGVVDWADDPPRLHFRDVPLRFDGATFGTTVDDDLLDEHEIDFTLVDHDDVHGVLSLGAGDRLRFVGTVHVGGEPKAWRLDVSIGFGAPGRTPGV